MTFVGSVMVPACVLSVPDEQYRAQAAASGVPPICSAEPGAPVTAYFVGPATAGTHDHVLKRTEAVRKNATIYVVDYQ